MPSRTVTSPRCAAPLIHLGGSWRTIPDGPIQRSGGFGGPTSSASRLTESSTPVGGPARVRRSSFVRSSHSQYAKPRSTALCAVAGRVSQSQPLPPYVIWPECGQIHRAGNNKQTLLVLNAAGGESGCGCAAGAGNVERVAPSSICFCLCRSPLSAALLAAGSSMEICYKYPSRDWQSRVTAAPRRTLLVKLSSAARNTC